MAENLAYKASSGCWAYNNDQNNVAKYGYLYNWETAKVVCPAGWHLPTNDEWTTLENYLGGEAVAGNKLKSATGWDGTNESGFSAFLGASPTVARPTVWAPTPSSGRLRGRCHAGVGQELALGQC